VKYAKKGVESKGFIIDLPFKYKRAVLTQSRTSKNRPYAFIVEFHNGSRKFLKGPFKDPVVPREHVICNEIKRILASKYLHPIYCEVKEYAPETIFLECEELGKADLSNVDAKPPGKLEKDSFEVLKYDDNDFIPDPFAVFIEINKDNQDILTGIIVNYCFRWVFGIGDAARRNLILQRSTGKIYSTDEIFRKSGNPEDIWAGKRPEKEIFKWVKKAFSNPRVLNEILKEVNRWKGYLNIIRREVAPIPKEVEERIDHLLKNPDIVLGISDVNQT